LREVGQNLPLRSGEPGSTEELLQPLLQEASYIMQ
jgi:hypothetical protein